MYEYHAKIINVVDGDTVDALIDVGFDIWLKDRLRLYGINTPEMHSKIPDERLRAIAAKQFVVDTLASRTPDDGVLTIRTYKDDKYGRLLAEIMLPANAQSAALDQSSVTTLNQMLVQASHALPYFGVGEKPVQGLAP